MCIRDRSVTGYEVQCALNKTFKSGRKTVKVTKAGTTSATMKKLKKGKKYCVRVRAYKVVPVSYTHLMSEQKMMAVNTGIKHISSVLIPQYRDMPQM